MRKVFLTIILACAAWVAVAQEKPDTLKVSDLYTTHIVFSTDVIYANLSNPRLVKGQIIDQSKNMVAVIAREPFDTSVSISALESNGHLHTFVVLYEKNPSSLLKDTRQKETGESPSQVNTSVKSGRSAKGQAAQAPVSPASDASKVTVFRKSDAPLPAEVLTAPRRIYHIYERSNDIEVYCTNIITYSDITYLAFSLTNRSGVSYECSNASFVVESKKKSRKSVVYEDELFAKSRYGTLSAGPGETAAIVYTLEKVSLTDEQVLKVYFFEDGGQRELILTLNTKDINKARNTL